MVGAVKRQRAMEFQVGRAGEANGSFDLGWAKNDFGEFGGLEDFFVHAGVAGGVAALAAGGEDDDFTGGFAGLRIEMEHAAF